MGQERTVPERLVGSPKGQSSASACSSPGWAPGEPAAHSSEAERRQEDWGAPCSLGDQERERCTGASGRAARGADRVGTARGL